MNNKEDDSIDDMIRKLVSTTIIIVLLIMLAASLKIQRVKASETIYINADGSIYPQDAPISSTDNITYVFTGDINESIIVQKDNIVIDGVDHTLNGMGKETGINLTGTTNTTIQNMQIMEFKYGIYSSWSSRINISCNKIVNNIHGVYVKNFLNSILEENNISNNSYGVFLGDSSENTLALNNVTESGDDGIYLSNSSDNTLTGNNVSMNQDWGIVLYSSSNSFLAENNIADNNYGLYLCGSSSNNTIIGNNATNNNYGIYLSSSSNNTLVKNNATDNNYGIWLWFSLNNTLEENMMNDNMNNLGVQGNSLSHFLHSINTSNTVNAKPVYYLINQTDTVINSDTCPQVGYLGLINCANMTAEGLELKNNKQGLLLAYTNNSTITTNNITDNACGILLYYSSNNTLTRNMIANNSEYGIILSTSSNNTLTEDNLTENYFGIICYNSSDNRLYHNNFLNNAGQIYTDFSVNIWDAGYPSGGNYWSNYNGVDEWNGVSQNENGSDGISDAAFSIDANNTDQYPLMAPISIFDAGTWNGVARTVDVISNSTVSHFQLDNIQKTVSFDVNVTEGTSSFCRVTIPKIIIQDLWQGNYTVLLNSEQWSFTSWTDTANTYIYISYTYSTHTVTIITESPSTVVALLAMFSITITIILAKRRLIKNVDSLIA